MHAHEDLQYFFTIINNTTLFLLCAIYEFNSVPVFKHFTPFFIFSSDTNL